jgi:hypothetical protein
MSGASRFQSRTVLGKNDIFLVSIREDGIWNDLLCDFLVFRPVGISLFFYPDRWDLILLPFKHTITEPDFNCGWFLKFNEKTLVGVVSTFYYS